MLKYVIYIAIAALAVWAVIYLIGHIRRQMKGDCSACGGGCGSGGGCQGCQGDCSSCTSKKE